MEISMKFSKNSRFNSNYKSNSSLCSGDENFRARKKHLKTKQRQVKEACKCFCAGITNNDSREVLSVWDELRQNKQLCDGIVTACDGTVFHIHRAILATFSPYFKACFINTLHRRSPEKSELHLNISSEEVSLIMDFAYTGTCKINSSNVQNLFVAADQLECVALVKKCCEFLAEQITVENCLGIFIFARHYSCRSLLIEALNFIRANSTGILYKSPEFIDLASNDVSVILSDEYLNIPYEESVYEAVDRWIETNPEERAKYILALFQCIRFGLMNKEYFDEVVKRHKYLDQEARLFLETVEIDAEYGLDCRKYYMRPRIPYEILFAVGGWSTGSPTTTVENYDVRADKWFLTDLDDSMARAYHGIVSLNNLLYMIGGYDGTLYFNSVKCFDPVAKTWTEKACMYCQRCYASFATYNGEIYVMGGFDGRQRMDSVEKYNPVQNQWQMMQSMRSPRSDASACNLNDKIYIVGGFNGSEVLSSAEMYDPCTGQWTYIMPMTSPRSGVSLLEYKNCIYAIGGYDGMDRLGSVEKYSPLRANCWQAVPSLQYARSNFAAIVLDELMFVIGGFDGASTINSVECFEEESNSWFEVAPMNVNRSALAVAICRGLPNSYDYSLAGNSNASSEQQSQADDIA